MAEYWFCVKHHTVEEPPDLCRAKDRLGPYDSRDAAAHALDKVAERNEEWEAEDDRFDGKKAAPTSDPDA